MIRTTADNKTPLFSLFHSALCHSDAVSPANVDFGKLLLCIVIDVIGSASELVPVLGEVTDVVWAPIAGLALRSLFGSNILFALEFAEEILPFTDILPLATLWYDEKTSVQYTLARFGGVAMLSHVFLVSSNAKAGWWIHSFQTVTSRKL